MSEIKNTRSDDYEFIKCNAADSLQYADFDTAVFDYKKTEIAVDRLPDLSSCSRSMRSSIKKLFRAFRFANDCNRSRWDFAVEILELQTLGISSEEVRWLIGKGLIDHADEVISTGQARRTFNAAGGFGIGPRSCFVLSDLGIAAAQIHVPKWSEQVEIQAESPVRIDKETPHWDKLRHELRMGETIIRKFKWRAANQEAILMAFEEDGWPPQIDDPLPPLPDKDPKRRLSDAVRCLNRKHRENVIRFSGDGTGEGVLWDYV